MDATKHAHINDLYGNTVIKLFLEMPNFVEIICYLYGNNYKGEGKRKGEIPIAISLHHCISCM
jgi:hypothetical protein